METAIERTLRDDDTRAWVDAIEDPRQRAVARRIPEIMGLFGLRAADVREERAGDDASDLNARALRMPAIGTIGRLLRGLGLKWNACSESTTSILDLKRIHHSTMWLAVGRAEAFAEHAGDLGLAYEAGLAAIRKRVEAEVSAAERTARKVRADEASRNARNAGRRDTRRRGSGSTRTPRRRRA